MIDLLLIPLCAGFLLALVAGPMGAFVVWQRMAYFGESLAHASLLGVALGLFWQQPVFVSTLAGCALVAVLLWFLQQQVNVSMNTLLGIVAHSFLALGLVVGSVLPGGQLNLEALLFGDLLVIDSEGLWILLAVTVIALVFVFSNWRGLVNMAVDESLARVEGVAVDRLQFLLLLVLALIIAAFVHTVGLLLIVSMLIIPAASAQVFCRSPMQMVICSSVLCGLAVLGGVGLSWQIDSPAGPSIVLCASVLFIAVIVLRSFSPGSGKRA